MQSFSQSFEFPPEELALINAVSGETGNMLFADYMVEWLEEKEHSIVENTIETYSQNVHNVIAPYFRPKGILLKNLKAKDVNDFYNSLRKQKLSEATIRNYYANIGNALRRAVRLQIISSNPIDAVEPPKVQRKRLQTYNEEQLNEHIKAVKGDPLELTVILASFCGLRRSEACGLRWKNVDFDNNLITINHSIVWDKKDKTLAWREQTC